jgi:bacteriocin-like protein
MNKKNFMPQKTNFINHATEELLTDFIELSENDLQQIVGGCGSHGGHTTVIIINNGATELSGEPDLSVTGDFISIP